MSLIIDRSDDARYDVIDEAFHLSEVTGIRTADRFMDATEKAYERLAQMPGIGTLRDYGNPDNAGMRFWAVPGFPKILIFYKPVDGILRIIRVLHGARDLQAIFRRDEGEE